VHFRLYVHLFHESEDCVACVSNIVIYKFDSYLVASEITFFGSSVALLFYIVFTVHCYNNIKMLQ